MGRGQGIGRLHRCQGGSKRLTVRVVLHVKLISILILISGRPSLPVRRELDRGSDGIPSAPRSLRHIVQDLGYRRGDIRVLELGVKAVSRNLLLGVLNEFTNNVIPLISNRYRLLAELTETALVHGLQLETSLPLYSSETSDIPHLISTQIPLAALQHPGYYYYTAANCSVQRWQRYKAALKHEVRRTSVG